MKRFLALIISILLILTLPGCIKNSNKYKLPPEREEGTKVELTLLSPSRDEEYELLKEIITLFEGENKDIKVNVERAPKSAQWNRIAKGLALGITPDLAMIDMALIPLLADRSAIINLNLLDLDQVKDEYIDGVMEWNTFNNKIWGITDQVNTNVLFYNKEIFDLLDLKYPDEHWTWIDLKRAANKLSQLEGVYGFYLGNSYFDTLPIVNSFGANPLLASSPETRDAVNFIKGFINEGASPNPWNQEIIGKVQGFKNGKYAMIMADMGVIPQFDQADLNYGTTLVPSGEKGAYSVVNGSSMVIFRNSPHPREAYKFIRFLTSERIQVKLANELGRIPVNKASLSQIDFNKHPHLELFIKQLDKAKSPPRVVDLKAFEEIISSELQQFFNGTKTIEEALQNINSRLRK